MATFPSTPLSLLAIPLWAAGCAVTVDHPSLAPRAVEQFTAIEPTPLPSPPVAIPADASRQERAATLLSRARQADVRFHEHLAEAQGAVARGSGASVGSEAWVQAQQAVSRTEAYRTPVAQSLADLDALQISTAETGIGTDARAALAAALSDVASIDAEQDRAIAALKERLSPP